MNEQEIDNLVGRELDLAVEKYIFGREQPQNASYEQLDDGTWQANIPDVYIDDDGYEYYARSWSVVEWPPYYHKSDCLVWQVVDTVLENRNDVDGFTLEFENHEWFSCFEFTNSFLFAGDAIFESRPIAICRAALKVVCNESV